MSITEKITVTHLTDKPTETAAPVVAGELVHVPAANVALENNVRTVADLDKGFLASVKRHGVLLPVIGYRDETGRIIVRDGQMRVLAALEAGISVPVLVTDRDTTDAKRVTEQLVANEQRTALTTGDRLAAYRQLELSGMTEAAISRETGTTRKVVNATLAVAKSEAATAAVTDSALTLDEALILAEFEGDASALASLHQAIEDGDTDDLPYYAERLRQDRARSAAVAKVTAEWEAKGVPVVADESDCESLSNLTDASDDVTDMSARPALDAESHAVCAGRAVMFRAWGEPVPVEVCTTPEAHRRRYPSYRGSTVKTAPSTPEEEQEQKDAEKAARRELIANNKAWDAADALRREFVVSLFQRKTLPKDWTLFIATTTTRFAGLIRNDVSYGVRTLLGVDTENAYGAQGVAEWVEKNPTKAGHVVLAHAVSAFENAADRNWWRYPTAEGKTYLTQLAAWGYRLTDVEKIATGQADTTETA
jgi:ParB family chromosome partitioning protein